MMSISLRQHISFIFVALFLITSGCATPIPIERDLAREAVMDADRAGAQKMAIVEYLEAQSTLERAEALLEDGDEEEAKETKGERQAVWSIEFLKQPYLFTPTERHTVTAHTLEMVKAGSTESPTRNCRLLQNIPEIPRRRISLAPLPPSNFP